MRTPIYISFPPSAPEQPLIDNHPDYCGDCMYATAYKRTSKSTVMALARYAILLMVLQSPFLARAQQPTVDLGYAQYAGTALSNGVSEFLGLPFAKAPIGDLRFAAPQPPDDTTGLIQATEVSSSAPYQMRR